MTVLPTCRFNFSGRVLICHQSFTRARISIIFVLLIVIFNIVLLLCYTKSPPTLSARLLGESKYPVTIVTGYFNMEPHKKGLRGTRTRSHYFDVLPLFKRLCFPLVVYSDNRDVIAKLRTVRANMMDITKLVYVNDRKNLWAFKLEDIIRDIYQQPGYPEHHPNTVLAHYSCIMHSKFDLVDMTIRKLILPSDLIGWMDLAYFRDLDRDKDTCLNISYPPGFDSSRVAYNQIHPFSKINTSVIIKDNIVWVGGGFILGKRTIFSKHIQDYRLHVERMLSMKLMSTDQQVLYSMFQNQSHHSIEIQTYDSRKCRCDRWFYLGYLCINHPCAN